MIHTDRALALLLERNMTQASLARRLDVTPSAVQQAISGKSKNSRLIPRIAAELNVSEEYLTGRSEERYRPTSGSMTPEAMANYIREHIFGSGDDVVSELDQNNIKVDAVFNKVWDPSWLITQVARVDYELFEGKPKDFFPKIQRVFVSNDAMAPTLIRGDQLLISMDSKTVRDDNGIWAISYGGLGMLRRLMPLPNGRGYRVSADNPSAPSFEAPLEDIEIRGLAFWMGRMLS